jgi:hypothetical protein
MPITLDGSGSLGGINNISTSASVNISGTELGYLDNTTSALQTQLGLKADILSNGAWSTYTPTITGFTLGNGTITGKYTQIGKTVIFRARFTYGSSSSPPNGSTYVTISRPPITQSNEFDLAYMNAIYLDSGTGWGPFISYGDSIWGFGTGGAYASIAYLSSTVPITWVANDSIYVSGYYEAA